MWILFAAGSALFAGVTAILAKCGIRKTDSTVATAIRTLVVLVFAWTMVFVGLPGGDPEHRPHNAPLSVAVRPGYRSLLAVLLQGPPAG